MAKEYALTIKLDLELFEDEDEELQQKYEDGDEEATEKVHEKIEKMLKRGDFIIPDGLTVLRWD